MVSSMRENIGRGMDSGEKTYEKSEDFHMSEVFSSQVVWSILRYHFQSEEQSMASCNSYQ